MEPAARSATERSNAGKRPWRMYIVVCSICSVATAAVMVPFSIFVVAPHVVQKILDTTSISLPNMTQLACGTNPYVQLFNSVEINVPAIGPIKPTAHLASYTQETWTTGCTTIDDGNPSVKGGFDCGENETELQLGHYSMQALTLNTGAVNHVNFSAVLNDNMTVAMSAWVIAFITNPVQKARLILKAKDVQVTSMGFTFKGLTMRNELTCTAMCTADCPTKAIPNEVCYPDSNDTSKNPDSSPAYHMVCVSGHHEITASPTPSPTASPTASPTEAPTSLTATIASAIGMIV